MKGILCLVIFPVAVFNSTATSQNLAPTVIYGTVLDTQDLPVAFANVQVLGTSEGASTQFDGQFEFVTDQVGLLNLRVTML